MKHILKRTLCLLLVLVMCLGMIPTVSAEEESVTISFADKTQRTSYSTSAQVWANGGVTMTNNKATSTTNVADYSNPARFYAGSNLVIEAPGNITKIVFTASSSSYASVLKKSAGSEATVSGSTVTIIPTASATTYTIAKLTAQTRATKLVVTYEIAADACQHSNTTTTTVDATCTTAGSVTVTCTDCNETVSTTVTPALGHELENGVCGVCGYEMPNYSGSYYIATKRASGNYFYMTSDLGTASTKRYTAVDSGLTQLPAAVTSAETTKIFTLILQDDGTYIIKTGDSYLGWSSGNSGILVEETAARRLAVDKKSDGTFNIHFTASDAERYLSLNNTSGNNYFAFYTGTQKQDLSLIPVEENCTHSATTTTTVDATCTTNGSVTVTCDDCGETVSTETIPATGHSYTNGVCGCGKAANVQVGENWYTTVQEAVSAAPEGSYVKLLDYSSEIVTVEKDLYLDLNGFDLDGVTVTGNATLYAMDSTTDDYDCSGGYGTIAAVTGNVAPQYKATVNGKVRRYVACDEGGGALSFHRIYVGITSISLRPGASGMGYKATVAGDQKVIEMMDDNAIGMTLWVFGDYENAKTVYMTRDKVTENMMVITARVQGMDVALHGETVLCATVSVNLNGTTITSSEAMYTLRQAVEAIAAAVKDGTAYTDAQMSALQDFCENNQEAMSTWSNIDAILNRSAAQ